MGPLRFTTRKSRRPKTCAQVKRFFVDIPSSSCSIRAAPPPGCSPRSIPTVAWGLCDLGMGFPEFGTVSLTELAEYRGRLGPGIERDLHFMARGPISAYIDAATKAGCIVETIDPLEDVKGGAP
jgi:hypothetical protein